MEDLVRFLGILIVRAIYRRIPSIYAIFYNLANARFFTDETISRISSNIYVLVSVVMLFTFSASLLSAIVNPDLLSDKKKGVGAVFKRAIIGIMLIVLIPFAFNEAYKIQAQVMDNALIEKVIVGISYDTTNCAAEDKDEDGKCRAQGGNGGQVIAGTLLSTILYPVADEVKVAVSGVEDAYSEMIATNVDRIKDMSKWDYINAAPEDSSMGKYAFEFEILLAIVAGFATVYILILYAMDTAVRMFKLAFFELTAPISIVAYVAAGPDMLKKWATEVGKTYVEVFIRIAGMAIYLFLISHLDDFTKTYSSMGLFFKLFLIIGMLIFVKQLPDIVNRAFGTNWQTKGGIGGRLGSMAVVGDTAKKAWDTVKKGLTTAGLTAAGVTAAVGTLGGFGAAGLGFGAWAAHHGWNKGFQKFGARPGKDTATGRVLRAGASAAGAFLGSGNPLKGISAAGKALSDSEVGKQIATDRLQKQQDNRGKQFRKKLNKIGRELGYDKDIINEDGTINEGMISYDALQKLIDSDSSLSKKQKANAKALFAAKGKQETLNGIKDQKQKILDEISNSQNSLNPNSSDYQARYNALEALKGNILNGNATAAEIDAKIKNLYSDGTVTGVAADNMGSALGKIMNAISSSNLDAGIKAKFYGEDGKANLDLSNKVLLSEITAQNQRVSAAESDYNKSKENATSFATEILGRYESTSDRVNNKAMFDQQGANAGGYSYKYTESASTGANSQPANDPYYGVGQEAYDEIISEGYKPGTSDFHERASHLAGYNGKGGMSTSSTYGMGQEAYDEIISEGYEPGTSDFHERASHVSGYNGLGASGVYVTSQPQQTTTTAENNSGATIINNYGTTAGGGTTAQVNVDMSGVENAMKDVGNKVADATKKAAADNASTITSKLDELHTTMKSSANLEARRDAQQMNQETKIIVDADGKPISSDSDK